MTKCPYCEVTSVSVAGMSGHIRGHHPEKWKGNIHDSIPSGFDLGTDEPYIIAAKTRNILEGGRKHRAQPDPSRPRWKSLEWRLLDNAKRRKKYRELRDGGASSEEARHLSVRPGLWKDNKKEYGCPYCKYSSARKGDLKKHTNTQHPKETGIVNLRASRAVALLTEGPSAAARTQSGELSVNLAEIRLVVHTDQLRKIMQNFGISGS